MTVFNITDRYRMEFLQEAEFDDVMSMHGRMVEPVMRRQHFVFSIKSRLGGLFEMRTKPNDEGQVATFHQGDHRKSLLDDLLEEANHAHKMVGKLEQYGDHLATCEMKAEDWEPEYEDDERSCTCGFASALLMDETFRKLVKEPIVTKWDES